jgi:hypothetical protein
VRELANTSKAVEIDGRDFGAGDARKDSRLRRRPGLARLGGDPGSRRVPPGRRCADGEDYRRSDCALGTLRNCRIFGSSPLCTCPSPPSSVDAAWKGHRGTATPATRRTRARERASVATIVLPRPRIFTRTREQEIRLLAEQRVGLNQIGGAALGVPANFRLA